MKRTSDELKHLAAREETRRFLAEYEQALQKRIRELRVNDGVIRATVSAAKGHREQRHLAFGPEAAFLNAYAVPVLHETLRQSGMQEPDAREALLNEFHPSMSSISRDGPARTVAHPFTKTLGSNARDIHAQWRGESDRGSALVISCPDFALRRPCPHRVVFEGKYYPRGSAEYGRRTLVQDLYQAFFYRALPSVPPKPRRAGWDYDYACLVALDASREGSLKAAWDELPKKVRDGFWEGAHVYVAIVRAHV